MSPEQLDGAGDVDAQSDDVGARRAMRLVAGEPPFPASGATPDALDDQRRARAAATARTTERARAAQGRKPRARAARDRLGRAARAQASARSSTRAPGELALPELERWLAGLGASKRDRRASGAAPAVHPTPPRRDRGRRARALSLALGALSRSTGRAGARGRTLRSGGARAFHAHFGLPRGRVPRPPEPGVAQGRDATLLLDMLARLRADLDKEDARDPVVG